MSYSNRIKSAKTENINMTLFDYCQGFGVFLEIKGIIKVLLIIPSDKSGAQHFYKCMRQLNFLNSFRYESKQWNPLCSLFLLINLSLILSVTYFNE